MRTVYRLIVVVLVLYAAAVAGIYAAMRQPPAQFGKIMSHLPMPAMLILPFETLWFQARGGALHPGDLAPDFSLPTLDHKAEVRLSSLRGQRPVVLVFGSYT